MSAAAYQEAEGAQGAPQEQTEAKDDNVVDAEYKVVDDEKK